MLINETKTLLTVTSLLQIVAPRPGLTPLLSGKQGIGKTQVIEQTAKKLNAYLRVLDGSILNEGEATGLPIVAKSTSGELEVQFAKHADIQAIKNLQKYYYEIATGDGFLNGRIKLDPTTKTLFVKSNVNGKEVVNEYKKDLSNIVIDGIDNQYNWGDELDAETKIELIKSGEIRPVVLFIDEINRCDMQTMKQLMNIILERRVNGYKFPWWVMIISAMNPSRQGSTFATVQFDPAQKDRFCKIPVETNVDNFVDYALAKNLKTEAIEALVTSSEIFMEKSNKEDSNSDDTDDMSGSSRSWEIVFNILQWIDPIMNIKEYFSDEDQKEKEKILRALIFGKVGKTAGATFIANLKNNDLNTPPEKIFTGKDEHISEEMTRRLSKQSSLRRKCTVNSVLNFLSEHWNDFEKKDMSKEEDKKKYMNFISQIKEFLNILDRNPRLAFFKQLIADQMRKYKCKDGNPLYLKLARFASKDILTELNQFSSDKDALNGEK